MQNEIFQILRDFRQGIFTPIGNSVFDYLGHANANKFLALIHPDDSLYNSNGGFNNKPVGYTMKNSVGLRLQKVDETWVTFSYTETLLEVSPAGDAAKTIISLFPSNHSSTIEQSLYESKERFRVLAEASFGGIGVHDKGKIIEANHELARMTGYEYNELIGMDGLLLIAPETRAMVMEKIVSGYEKPYEAKGIRKDGTIYSLEIQGKQVPYNGKIVRVTEFRNIEERKRTEETIRLGDERFKAIVEFAVDGIILGDSKGVIVDSNMRFLEISGLNRENVVGNHIGKLFTSENLSSKPFRFDLLLEGKTVVSEREILRPDGTTVHIEMHSKMMPDGSYQSIIRDISKRKLTEIELAKEQFLMHLLMENVPEQIYFKDNESKFLRVNQSVVNRFQLSSPNEAIGKTDFNFFTEEHASWARKVEQEIMATGKPVIDIEEQETWPDGKVTWVSTSKMPIENHNGEIIGTFGVSRDITSRKQTEEALRKSEELFRLVVDATDDAIWDWDLITNKAFFSDRYYTMLGYTSGEFEGSYQSWRSLIHPNDLKWAETLIGKFIKEQVAEFNLEFRLREKTGGYKWIHARGKIVEKSSLGEPLRIIGVHEDITERKKTEEAVKLERAYFEQLFESSPEGVVILDVNDKVLRCNREFSKIFGYTNDEAIGKQINDLIVPRDLADEGLSLTHMVAKGKQIMRETIRMRKDGSAVHVSILGKPIHFEGGQIAVYGIYRDISDRKLVEEELVRKNYEIEAQNEEYRVLNEELQLAKEKAEESDRLKSAFLANMSHEVRTPMNGIIGFTQLLANSPIQQPEFNQYLGVIESCGNQLLTIINDLIDISKIEANQLTISETEVNINQLLLKQHLLFLQKANGLGVNLVFQTSLPDDACTVITDGARLQQVLSNLLGNALKFTTKGNVTFGYSVKSNKIEFFVSDTGIGIPKAQHGYIFERFRQVENHLTAIVGGTGLGLAISKALVNLMGGEISVESEPNVGSTFSFTIPYKPVFYSRAEDFVLPEAEGTSIPKGKRVLIAEDDEYNYMYIRELLNELNVEHVRVANGAEAFNAVMNDSNIDLLLLDLKMPVMDGYEVARKIRQVNSIIPIIAQTAYAFSSDREKSLHAGCNDYVSKPIDRKEFERLLAKYLK